MRSVSSETVSARRRAGLGSGGGAAAASPRRRSRVLTAAWVTAILIWAGRGSPPSRYHRTRTSSRRPSPMTTRSRLFFLASLAVGVVLGLFVSIGLQRACRPLPLRPRPRPPVQPRPVAERADLDSEEKHTIALFKGAAAIGGLHHDPGRAGRLLDPERLRGPFGHRLGIRMDDEATSSPTTTSCRARTRRRSLSARPSTTRRRSATLVTRTSPSSASTPREQARPMRVGRAPTSRSARRCTRSATPSASTTP